jgi:hypothetical protein
MHDQEGGKNDASGNASRTLIQRWGKHPETGLHRIEFIHAAGLIEFFVEGVVATPLQEKLSIWTLGMQEKCPLRSQDPRKNKAVESAAIRL